MLLFRINDNQFVKLDKARSHKYIEKKSDGKGGFIYIYHKKSGEDRNAINYNDMRDFGYDNAVKISKDINNIRNSLVEHSKIYDSDGNVIFSKTGTEKGIEYTSDELNKIKNSRLLIHNHPSADSFSTNDLYLIIEKNIKEIRACGIKDKRKSDFSIKLIKNIPEDYKKILLSRHHNILQEYKKERKSWPAHGAMIEFLSIYGRYFRYVKLK